MATLTINSSEKPRKMSRADKLDEFLRESEKAFANMRGWADLGKEVAMPAQFAAALITGRPELLRLVPVDQPLTAEEMRAMYDFIATLIEANTKLQTHAQLVSEVVKNWADGFKSLSSLGHQIERFANFKAISEHDDEEA